MSQTREANVGRIETPDLMAVKVRYEVERTVYVYAFSPSEARQLARDPSDWADAGDDQHEDLATVRVLRKQA